MISRHSAQLLAALFLLLRQLPDCLLVNSALLQHRPIVPASFVDAMSDVRAFMNTTQCANAKSTKVERYLTSAQSDEKQMSNTNRTNGIKKLMKHIGIL